MSLSKYDLNMWENSGEAALTENCGSDGSQQLGLENPDGQKGSTKADTLVDVPGPHCPE